MLARSLTLLASVTPEHLWPLKSPAASCGNAGNCAHS